MGFASIGHLVLANQRQCARGRARDSLRRQVRMGVLRMTSRQRRGGAGDVRFGAELRALARVACLTLGHVVWNARLLPALILRRARSARLEGWRQTGPSLLPSFETRLRRSSG